LQTALAQCPKMSFPTEFQTRLLKAINECPNGVIALSKTVPGLVETSTTLAIINTADNHVTIKSSQRSSINAKREQLSNSLGELWAVYGGDWTIDSEYPGWAPRPESELLKIARQAYKRKVGFEPQPTAIHAGLECGIIGDFNPAMDIISFGPDIRAAHSPDENVDITSVADFWTVLLEILQNIAENNV
jgi:dipeptidase D